jgi:hypothetical protein
MRVHTSDTPFKPFGVDETVQEIVWELRRPTRIVLESPSF